ncbi:ribonuclease Z [Tenacibaculum skagerrakense]|uniref:Ribonuclease Z n=1 Tax=Tenacibaculum skagerrakense TaxID=186571 RepID=A0A4R2P1S1_9FLAO|nr:peptidase [Tenacibaculum skagerrakense]TCP27884.1 ribonuclease Z [Tenacibaculum skagerrakense]
MYGNQGKENMFTATVKSTQEEDISILIQKDNHSWNYICDCGEASGLTIKEIQNTKAVFISHTHIDHFINFDSIIRHQIGIENSVVICGPTGIAQQIQAKLLGYTWNLIEENSIQYEVRELHTENQFTTYQLQPPLWKLEKGEEITNECIYNNNNFEVSAILLDHKIPTVAYKFQEKEKIKIDMSKAAFKPGKWVKELKDAYENLQPDSEIVIEENTYKAKDLFNLLTVEKGDSVGIIMDHAPSAENHQKIKTHFKSCKTVLIESFYLNEDKELALKNFHSFAAASGSIARKTEIENVIPVHFSRKYSSEQITQLKEEFYQAYRQSN